jgi:hypothetical protein
VKNQIKVLGRNVLFVRAFFLAKANNLAAIEFGKKLSKKKSKKEKGTSKSRLLVRKESQKAKRFGLRMVEGDIFQSERRSSK